MGERDPSNVSVVTAMRVEVLMAEYLSLREEAMQRDTILNQALLGAAAAIIGFATFIAVYSAWLFGSIAIIGVIALAFRAYTRIVREVSQLSDQLIKLESRINEVAGE
ncbi:MAG: hypothetical protein ABL996_18790 [Micropepsaceae bacterium]